MITNLGWGLLVVGIIISALGAIGCIKFPRFYSKLHALSVSDSFGIPVALCGLILIGGLTWLSLKILFLIFILLLTSALSTHALVRAGIRNKISFDDLTTITLNDE